MRLDTRCHAPALAALVICAGPVVASQALVAAGGAGGCVRDVASGAVGQCSAASGLAGASGIAVSPDGRNVYVASAGSGAVVTLGRRQSGALSTAARPSRRACVGQVGGADCATTTPGLAGADTLLVTPDGRNVYAGSLDDAAVVALNRGRNGLLSPLRVPAPRRLPGARHRTPPAPTEAACIQGQRLGAAGRGRCGLQAPALAAVRALAISPDQRFLYAVSFGNATGGDSIEPLRRNLRSGALAPLRGACVSSLGGHLCRLQTPGLRGASAIALSPDGRFAYVASALSSAVVGFARDPSGGSLAPVSGLGACVADPAPPSARGDVPCPVSVPGLRGARGLAISPDGRFVYVAGFDPGSIAVLARDPATGRLAPIAGGPTACLEADLRGGCTSKVDGLRGAAALAMSADGRVLYVAALADAAVLAIRLSAGLPQLPLPRPVAGGLLGAPAAVALAPGGRSLYVASPLDDGVAGLRP